MDLPPALVHGAPIHQVRPELGRRFAAQIGLLEKSDRLDDFVALLVPDLRKVFQESGKHLADARAARSHDMGRDRNVGAVDVNARHPGGEPVARRQRHVARGGLGPPGEPVLQPDEVQGIGAGPLESDEPEALFVLGPEEGEPIRDPRGIDVLGRIETRIPLVPQNLLKSYHPRLPFAGFGCLLTRFDS